MELTRFSLCDTENIKGYGGRYKIDVYGNVWRVWRHFKNGKLYHVKMKPIFKREKMTIRLSGSDGKRKEHTVARLVAEHFIPKPYMANSVVHINGDKRCNHVDNLMWLSKRQLGLKYGHKVKKAFRICKVDKDGIEVEYYRSARAAAKANYMSYQTILDRVNGKVKGKYAPDGYEYRRVIERG